MTPKGFLYKATTKSASNAKEFIDTYREYLSTELSSVVGPILNKLDAGEIYPTPALEAIKESVFQYLLSSEAEKLSKQTESTRNVSSKKFSACIRDDISGQILIDSNGKELSQSFDLPQRAKDWCDRKLFEYGGFGEVLHNLAHQFEVKKEQAIELQNQSSRYEYISREDAIARILRTKSIAFHKVMRPSQSKLGFGVKVNPTISKFSCG